MTSTANAQLTDVHDMVVVHRVFRREFTLLPQLVRGVAPGDTGRAALLTSHARLLLDGLHMHHTSEDALLWPKLLERCTPDAELVHRMEAQHERVEHYTEQLHAALARWEAEARPAVTEEVAATFDGLRDALFEHLAEEEQEILPLAARHITQAEWDSLGEHGRETMTRQQLPLFFGAVTEEASPEERRAMLAPLPAPIRLLARTLFAWQYRRYVRRVRG